MKRLFFGLFAAAVALGGSAFTNAAPKPHFATFYYVLTTAGTYIRTTTVPSDDNCINTAAHPCYLGYSTDKGASFPSSSIPASPTVQSNSKALYVD